jgi:uncharacterized protein
MSWLKQAIKAAIFLYLLFGWFLFQFQDHFLYHPVPEATDQGLQEWTFQTRDKTSLKIFMVNEGQKNALLYFGGNAESVALNAPDLQQSLPERTLFFINYRGYAGSEGKPSEELLFDDATQIFDAVAEKFTEIAVIGRSLGSGVAAYLAAHRPVRQLILVTPFDSIEQVAQQQYPLYPISWLLRDKYDSLSHAPKIKANVLIMLAEHDSIINPERSIRLINAFTRQQLTAVTTIKRSNHNNIASKTEYYRQIQAFLH